MVILCAIEEKTIRGLTPNRFYQQNSGFSLSIGERTTKSLIV